MLTQRQLNRATLDRQLLLRRVDRSAYDTIGLLVGLQAQEANSPYLSLWNRLAGFAHDELTGLLRDRSVVRGSALRGTQHLVASEDYLWIRPLIRPILLRGLQAAFGRHTRGLDLEKVAEVATELLTDRTLTRPQVGALLADRFPGYEKFALGWAVQAVIPVIHQPPSGTWGKGGATPFTLAEEWIGRPADTSPDPERLILRYLAGYGPAGVMDIQTFSRLTRLREVVDRMRPRLRVYRNEAGKELFDLPELTISDAETPAPVRFLPYFDNLLIAHSDRTRVMTDEIRRRVCVGAIVHATLFVDGEVRGLWTIKREDGTATLRIQLFAPLSTEEADEAVAEAARLLDFAAAGDRHDIQFTPGG